MCKTYNDSIFYNTDVNVERRCRHITFHTVSRNEYFTSVSYHMKQVCIAIVEF